MSTKTLRNFWSQDQKDRFDTKYGKGAPRTHRDCFDLFGIARPGKTRKDRFNRTVGR